jgi:hypothetical protein
MIQESVVIHTGLAETNDVVLKGSLVALLSTPATANTDED